MKCREIRHELQRLSNHIGFPTGLNLSCPIFLQDKLSYIRSLPQHHVIPSYCVSLPLVTPLRDFEEVGLINFLSNHSEGCGWVVKAPFTTNGEGVSFCKTKEDVLEALRRDQKKFAPRDINYLIVQPCLENAKEYKVVCLGGHPQYISKHSRSGKGSAFSTRHEVMTFARKMLTIISENNQSVIVNMLCRVDVMMYKDKLVVNEFESFEALYSGPGDHEYMVTPFLIEFWKHKLMLAANELLC